MTQKLQTKEKVLTNVLVDQVTVCQATEVLNVSERRARCILRTYGEKGPVHSPTRIVAAD